MNGFFSTSVIGGEAAIRAVLLTAIANHFNAPVTIAESVPAIQQAVAEKVEETILQSSEYNQITDAPLWHALGIADPIGTLSKVIARIKQSVNVQKQITNASSSNVSGGFKISILPADYSDLLSMPEASFISENGEEVKWLEWLLLGGTAVLIPGWYYIPAERESSRTGLGIMVPTHNKPGWSLPPEYAGTADDNWLTRALTNGVPGICEAIANTVNKVL